VLYFCEHPVQRDPMPKSRGSALMLGLFALSSPCAGEPTTRGDGHAPVPGQPQSAPSSITAAEKQALALEQEHSRPNNKVQLRGRHGPFNPSDFLEGWELAGAALWARPWHRSESNGGWELALARSSQTVQHGLSLSGTSGPVVRYLGDGDVSLSLSRHRIVGGAALGRFEILGGFGFSTVTLDRIHEDWGIGLLAPLSTVSVAASIGRLRVECGGYLEYLWRWNAPDYFIRGVSLALRVRD
jgi:hypothetical protein